MTGPAHWHILTGEYPPQPGGVSDYSALVAAGLAAGGGEVHVWAPPATGEAADVPGVTIHRIAGSWSSTDLARIGEALDRLPHPRRLLVQYAPNSFGKRGMNLGFCRWLLRRSRRGDEVRIMFHEVRYSMAPGDSPLRLLLPPIHLWMARTLVRAATYIYISIPTWAERLKPVMPKPVRTAGLALVPSSVPAVGYVGAHGGAEVPQPGAFGADRRLIWAPVPSNIPAVDDPAGVAEIRARYGRGGALIGSFGTFLRGSTTGLLSASLPRLLTAQSDRVGLLIGRNGQAFADRLVAEHPALEGRLFATGGLAAEDVSRHLQACDLLIQPDSGGLCAKQGSTMAGLGNGCAIVAASGWLTEPIWTEERCVALAPANDPPALAVVAEACLSDRCELARLRQAASSTYERYFSIERTIALLTGIGDSVT